MLAAEDTNSRGGEVIPHVILTRPAAETERSRPLYARLGLHVHAVPLIELAPCSVGVGRLQALADRDFDAVLVTSGAAAERWFEVGGRLLTVHRRWVVVGRRAAERVAGGDPDGAIVAVEPDGERLLAWFDRAARERPARLLYPCSADRTDALVEGLRARGVEVEELPLYRPDLPAEAVRQLGATFEQVGGSPVVLVFHSPSAVLNFFRCAAEAPVGAIFAAIGATTAAPLRERGLQPIVPIEPTDAALAEAVARRLQTSPLDPTA